MSRLLLQVPCTRCKGPAGLDVHNLHMCGTCNGRGVLDFTPNCMINLDLDGVHADFDRHAKALLGANPRDLDDDTMWERLNAIPDFFATMPMCDGALEFYESIKHLGPVFLTACPKSNYAAAARQKHYWVRKNLSSTAMILPVQGGRNKPLFMQRVGDILIDDHLPNCEAWVEAGGVAILHRDFPDTTKQLVAVLTEKYRNKH